MATSNPDPSEAQPPRAKRWIPVSVKTFTALLLLFGLGSALWIGLRGYPQWAAIHQIEETGYGSVMTERMGPAWLRAWVGDQLLQSFETVRAVAFSDVDVDAASVDQLKNVRGGQINLSFVRCQLSESALDCLQGLSSIKDIQFSQTNVTDEGLAQLKTLPNLEVLELDGTGVTNAGLKNLKNFPALECLRLVDSQVTESGLADLQRFTRIKVLFLCGAQVIDEHLAGLKSLESLEALVLLDTSVTGPGLVNLRGLNKLTLIEISLDVRPESQFGDAGLEHLVGLSHLKRLSLQDLPITDAGLTHLARLQGLASLYLTGTHVTDDGAKTLRQALPQCDITIQGP
jgi:hypothetical protein